MESGCGSLKGGIILFAKCLDQENRKELKACQFTELICFFVLLDLRWVQISEKKYGKNTYRWKDFVLRFVRKGISNLDVTKLNLTNEQVFMVTCWSPDCSYC